MHALKDIIKAVELLPEEDRVKLREHLEQQSADEDIVVKRLRAAGVGVQTPRSTSEDFRATRLPPLKVPGEPVSAQIIRERR